MTQTQERRTQLISKLLLEAQPHHASLARLIATDVHDTVGTWLEDEIVARDKPGEALCALAEFFTNCVISVVYQTLPQSVDAGMARDIAGMVEEMIRVKLEDLRANGPGLPVEAEPQP